MNKRTDNLCFVMMPFGEASDKLYDQIYKPAIESSGFISKRADSLFRPSPIIQDIWEYINNSKILLADLTGLNPNVMYELGLAHAISKPVILISDDISNVPFDLRFLRILIYDNKSPDWAEKLRQSIQISISEILTSPTDSILPAFLKLRPYIQETDQISAELIEIKQLIIGQSNFANGNLPKEKNQTEKKKGMTVELLEKASKDARNLYYNEGWDITDIKDHLVEKYELSAFTANDIFHRSI